MIIAIKGANGAGKSTLVRALMDDYQKREPIRLPGRRKPGGYELRQRRRCLEYLTSVSRCGLAIGHDGECSASDGPESAELFVPGHYEIANGGVDTLDSLDTAYDLIQRYDTQGFHVVYEGKNAHDGVNRIAALGSDRVVVVHIEVTVTECIASVRARGHSISDVQISRVWQKVTRDVSVLTERGFQVRSVDRASALTFCRSLLAKP